ncbi:MAG: nucleotidyltransferase domain-containing protein [Alphaproteobacteria bacterium]|nr:nucleotidyltransferase domain-containing protein [Alphaproteobacteria bacterium]
MISGMSLAEEKIVKDILCPFSDKYDFYFYGSRVKGNFSKLSDLDILIKGKNEMPFNELETIKQQFDESSLPYVVNFFDYHKINEQFYNLIKQDLVSVF